MCAIDCFDKKPMTEHQNLISPMDNLRKHDISKFLSSQKRTRKMFNQTQINILEEIFEQTHYPDSTIRVNLSNQLNLSVARIQVWFQNRRAKYRKMDAFKISKK